jgi:hypothetical protein
VVGIWLVIGFWHLFVGAERMVPKQHARRLQDVHKFTMPLKWIVARLLVVPSSTTISIFIDGLADFADLLNFADCEQYDEWP